MNNDIISNMMELYMFPFYYWSQAVAGMSSEITIKSNPPALVIEITDRHRERRKKKILRRLQLGY